MLIIKGADFSENALDKVHPGDIIYNYAGTSDGVNKIDSGLNLLDNSITKWTMFVSYSNAVVSGNYKIIVDYDATGTFAGIEVACNVDGGNIYRKFADNMTGTEGVSMFKNQPTNNKIGFRRNENKGYMSIDGVTWIECATNIPYANVSNLILFGKPDGTSIAPSGINLELKIWLSETKDISDLFI